MIDNRTLPIETPEPAERIFFDDPAAAVQRLIELYERSARYLLDHFVATLGGRPPELISQVRDGVVDLVWTLNGYTPGLFPRTEVMELPFVYLNDPVAANLALADIYPDHLAEEYKGVEPMFLHSHAGQAIQTVSTEVHKPEDLAGVSVFLASAGSDYMTGQSLVVDGGMVLL